MKKSLLLLLFIFYSFIEYKNAQISQYNIFQTINLTNFKFIAMSDDGLYVTAAQSGNTAKLYMFKFNQTTYFNQNIFGPYNKAFGNISLSTFSSRLSYVFPSNYIQIYQYNQQNLTSIQNITTFPMFSDIRSGRLSVDGKYLIATGFNSSGGGGSYYTIVYTLGSNLYINPQNLVGNIYTECLISPDNQFILGYGNNQAGIFHKSSTNSFIFLGAINSSLGKGNLIGDINNETIILASSSKSYFRVLKKNVSQYYQYQILDSVKIKYLSISSDSQTIISININNQVVIYNFNGSIYLINQTLTNISSKTYYIKLSDDKKILITCQLNGFIKIYLNCFQQYCQSCLNTVSCNSCIPTYALIGGVCKFNNVSNITGCSFNQTLSNTTNQCVSCQVYNCSRCDSSDRCSLCNSQLVLINGLCYTYTNNSNNSSSNNYQLISCIDGFYFDFTSFNCQPCHTLCKTCLNYSLCKQLYFYSYQSSNNSVQQFSWITFICQTINFPNLRSLFKPSSLLLMTTDHIWFYQYHSRNYSSKIQKVFDLVRYLSNQKFIPLFIDDIGKNLIEVIDNKTVSLNCSYYSNYTNYNYYKLERIDGTFYSNTKQFFVETIPINLFSNYYGIMKLVLYLDHSHYQGVSLNNTMKMRIIICILVFFSVVVYSTGFYFISLYFYDKLSKYLIPNCYRVMPSFFWITLEIGVKNIILGIIHSSLYNHYDYQIRLLMVVEILLICFSIYMLKMYDCFKNITTHFIRIITSFLLVLLQLMFILDQNQNRQQLIQIYDDCQYVLVICITLSCTLYIVFDILITLLKPKQLTQQQNFKPQTTNNLPKQTKTNQQTKYQKYDIQQIIPSNSKYKLNGNRIAQYPYKIQKIKTTPNVQNKQIKNIVIKRLKKQKLEPLFQPLSQNFPQKNQNQLVTQINI